MFVVEGFHNDNYLIVLSEWKNIRSELSIIL